MAASRFSKPEEPESDVLPRIFADERGSDQQEMFKNGVGNFSLRFA